MKYYTDILLSNKNSTMAEKELQELQKLHNELTSVKKIMGTLQQRINQIEEVIYFKCDHYWILDRANVGEHTEYICTHCNLSKNDNLNPK
jgi:t-SNARE complex subunit (syntaxin)